MGKRCKEEWRVINECPSYSVSNHGRVKNNRTESIKSMRKHKGYRQVKLYRLSGEIIYRTIHRLVAEAFIPNPEGKPQVNHRDGIKLNNDVSNLEWVTAKENCIHAWKHGLSKPSRSMLGKSNPNAGKPRTKVRIVETGEEFNSVMDCARAINGNDRHIHDCFSGKQHTHRGYHFERID